MIKQIELFGPYDPDVQKILKYSKIEKGKPSAKEQEENKIPQFYQTELLDMNNPEEYRFAIDLHFNCTMPKGSNPVLNFLYYKEFGPHEKFKQAEKALDEFWKLEDKVSKDLVKELENSSKDVQRIKKYFYLNNLEYYVEIAKKRN